MFPKTSHASYVSTPTITSVVQNLMNYQIVYELGLAQNQSGLFVEILENDVVIYSETQGENVVQRLFTTFTRSVGTYAAGAVIKVRVTADNITKTSTGFTTTFALFSGFPTLDTIIVYALRDEGPGLINYEWGWQADNYPPPSPVPAATYSNVSVSVILESKTTSPPSGFVLKHTISGNPADWLDSTGGPHFSSGQSSQPDQVRATLTINVAGYSTSIVSPENIPL